MPTFETVIAPREPAGPPGSHPARPGADSASDSNSLILILILILILRLILILILILFLTIILNLILILFLFQRTFLAHLFLAHFQIVKFYYYN